MRRENEAGCKLKNGRGRPVAGAPPLSDGCKPDSVRPHGLRPGACTAICLAPHLAGGTAFAGCDYYPEGSNPLARPEWAGNPCPPVLSCTAWGFSCPPACAGGGGLLPRLFTLTSKLASGGGLFSVTLSVGPGFRPCLPRVLRGMLPCGVRTFLSVQTLRHARNGRPPSPATLLPPELLHKGETVENPNHLCSIPLMMKSKNESSRKNGSRLTRTPHRDR